MLLCIQHETKLSYSAPVTESVFEVRMAPISDEDQTTLGYRLRLTPMAPVSAYRDGFGNRVDLFNILAPYREVLVRSTSFVRVHRRPIRSRLADVPWPVPDPSAVETLEYLQHSPLVDHCAELETLLAEAASPPASLLEGIERLMNVIQNRLKYEKKVTTARTPLSEALFIGRGVCQDFSHLLLGLCLRPSNR